MGLVQLLQLGVLAILGCVMTYSTGPSSVCDSSELCGWNSDCLDNKCVCKSGYSLASNKRDCIDTRCGDEQCLKCTSTSKCIRCVDFVEERTGICMSDCKDNYMLVIEGDLLGKVCPEAVEHSSKSLYIYIIAGCVFAIVILLMIALMCCCQYKNKSERKDRLKAMSKLLERERYQRIHPVSNGRIPGFANPAYSTDASTNTTPITLPRSHIRHKLDALRENGATLQEMTQEVCQKLEQLDPKDKTAIELHRNVIEQLERVQNILHPVEFNVQYPEDISELLQWALKIVIKYKQVQTKTPNTSLHLHSPYRPSDKRRNRPPTIMGTGTLQNTLQSTFKPDHVIVKDTMHFTHTDNRKLNFKYGPCTNNIEMNFYSRDEEPVLRLEGGYTEPIEV